MNMETSVFPIICISWVYTPNFSVLTQLYIYKILELLDMEFELFVKGISILMSSYKG